MTARPDAMMTPLSDAGVSLQHEEGVPIHGCRYHHPFEAQHVYRGDSTRSGPGVVSLLAGALQATVSLGGPTTVTLVVGDNRVSVDCTAKQHSLLSALSGVASDMDTLQLIVPGGDDKSALLWELQHGEVRVSARGDWYPETVAALPRATWAGAEFAESGADHGDPFDRDDWVSQSVGRSRPRTDSCLYGEISAAADSAPNAIAVQDEDGAHRLTYVELFGLCEDLARILVGAGVEPGDLVALDVPRGPELVVAMLGVWRARCAFVALDPSWSEAQSRHVVEVSGPRLIVRCGTRERGGDAQGAPVVYLDDPPPTVDLPTCCQPQDLAYVMFTSGSTGAPKGASVAHNGVLNHALAKLEDLNVSAADVVAQTGPIQFDILVWQCVAPLMRGARVVVISDYLVRDVRATLRALDEASVTVWQALPAIIRAVLSSTDERPSLDSLRWLVPTGDALPSDLCRDWLAAYPDVPLLNTYGSTECSDDQCHHVIREVAESDPPIMLIGRPIPGMAAYVLDSAGRVTPPGVAGEIYIGGIGVGPGYWRRADLTSQRFVTVPGLEEAGTLYRSGDAARRRPDGAIEFLARIDNTVKIRGRRIEVALVEEAVRSHPEVHDCAVIARSKDDDLTDTRLIAYVAAVERDLPSDLREHVATVLDPHHVPDRFVAVPEIPLTANGKVNRAALPAAEPMTGSGDESGKLRAGAESVVAALFAEVLESRAIGPNDDFFVLGGHSLMAARMLARLEAETGVRLPLSAVFDSPTVGALTDRLSEAGDDEAGGFRVTVGPDPGGAQERRLPLTDLQQAYWVGEADFFAGGRSRAHLYVELDTEGLEVATVRGALDVLVAAHEALRVVVLDDGTQRVLTDPGSIPVEEIDASAWSKTEIDRRLGKLRACYRDEGPETATWPLLRISVVHLGSRQRVFVGISLLLLDAVSEAVIVRDLIRILGDGRLVDPKGTPAYSDVIEAVARVQDQHRLESRAYWRERLADFPGAPQLPWRQPAGQTGSFRRRVWSLEAEVWGQLKRQARSLGLTPTAALFTAYAETLAVWSKSGRFAVNTLASLRMAVDPDVSEVVGNLGTTLPVLVDLSSPNDFTTRARSIQARLVRDFEHCDVSGVALSRLVARDEGWAEGQAQPIVFASTLDVDTTMMEPLPFSANVVTSGIQTPHIALDHQVYEYGGRLQLVFDAVDDAFQPDVVDGIWHAYTGLIDHLAADSDAWRRPVEFPSARRTPEVAPARAALALNGSQTLHGAFVERAVHTPAPVAVVDGELALSYGQLLGRAHDVARVLTEQGVRSGDVVAHVMHRGWEQVAAMLGTLLVGAAYLPVDESLPDERIELLVGQSTAPVVLSQSSAVRRLSRLGTKPVDVSACVDDNAPPPDGLSAVSGQDLAYVIFTSGSTGHPKGVMIDHRGAVNTIAAVNQLSRLDESDAVLGLSSTSFDLSVWDVFGTLSAGGRLVLLDPGRSRDPWHWHDQVQRHGVTVWNSVPALFELYLGYLGTATTTKRTSTRLRTALLSGDWIPVSLPERARRLLPELGLTSLGGATEGSIWSISYDVDVVHSTWSSIPYGRALPNQGVHVLDERLRPRPDWVTGELYISGVGVALGYWQDPQRTDERFLIHPTSGERLYRTGDLGRRRPDGVIEFLGREDGQVKLHGHRVELGEIEAILTTHPRVNNAAVAMCDSARDGRVLIGYVSCDGDAYSSRELRDHVAKSLPRYMVPHHFVRLDHLPLTLNGKVDRTRLPAQVPETRNAETDRSEQQLSGNASVVQAEMEAILEAPVGGDESFFDCGGNSFSAMRLVGRLRKHHAVDLSLSSVFDTSTPRTLGAALDRLEAGVAPASADPLVLLRSSGSLAPLFLIHPVGGAISCYDDIISALDSRRPVVGVQSTAPPTDASLSVLAARYADLIGISRPDGSICVGGWSMGGVLAFEVARCLQDRGRTIESVLVVDAAPQIEDGSGDDPLADFLFDLIGGGEPAPGLVQALARVVRWTPDERQIAEERAAVDLLAAAGVWPIDADAAVLRERYEIFHGNLRLLAGHSSRQCDLPVVVVHGTESHLDASATADAWQSLSRATVHAVRADHHSIVRGAAAAQVGRALEEAVK